MSTINSRIRFAYLRDGTRPIGVCAYRVIGSLLYVGAAFCSSKDSFNKKVGRNLALERLNNSPAAMDISMYPEKTLFKIAHHLAFNLVIPESGFSPHSSPRFPAWFSASRQIRDLKSRLVPTVNSDGTLKVS